jgi:hypothetical protein
MATMTLEVSSVGVRLDQSFDLVGLPDTDRLQRTSFQELPLQRKRWGNRMCEVRRFRCEITPIQAGDVLIAPRLRAGILTRTQGLIGSTWVRTLREVEIDPVRLKVKPLPAKGKPAAFSGAVGRFILDVDVNPLKVAVGDLITVKSRVRGEGYMEDILAPRVVAGRHFKIYDARAPATEDKQGARVFEQTLIPQDTNALSIASVSFSYFDTGTGTYRTLKRGPFRLSFHSRQAPRARQPFRPEVAEDTATPARKRDQPSGTAPSRGARLVPGVIPLGLCIAGLILAAGTACISAVVAVRRLTRGRASPWGLVVLVAAIAGFAVCVRQTASARTSPARTQPVLPQDAKARLAPGPSALPTFDLPAGATVTILESYAGWAKVAHGNRRGWIPSDALDSRPGGHTP